MRVAVDYARQILAALDYAHRNGIVHRDIKPHNIVVAPDGRIKVMDFGIARSGSSQVTEAGSIIGTAQYLSPEQARGLPAGPSADLYSTGIVLYEMLTGSVPFGGDTPLEVAMQHLTAVPEPPSAKRPEIPHELDAIVLRALAKDSELAIPQRARYGRRPRALRAGPLRLAGHGGRGHLGAGRSRRRRRRDDRPRRLRGAHDVQALDRPLLRLRPAVRRRPFWPWLLAALLVVAAGFAAYYVYDRIADQIAGADLCPCRSWRASSRDSP